MKMKSNIDYFKKDSSEIQSKLPKDNYPQIVRAVLEYINYIKVIEKKKKQKNSLVDIIYDFCLNNDYDPELVGDAIHSDEYFTKAIMNECLANGVIRSKSMKKLGDW